MATITKDPCFRELPFSDQLLIWAARVWVDNAARGPGIPANVSAAFSVAGIPEAAGALHELLLVIGCGAKETVYFLPVSADVVSCEERHLLRIVASSRSAALDDLTWELLAAWLPPTAAMAAVAPSRVLASSLARFETLRTCGRELDERERRAWNGTVRAYGLIH